MTALTSLLVACGVVALVEVVWAFLLSRNAPKFLAEPKSFLGKLAAGSVSTAVVLVWTCLLGGALLLWLTGEF